MNMENNEFELKTGKTDVAMLWYFTEQIDKYYNPGD